MMKKEIDLSQALELGHKLPYVWIRSLSSVYMGKNNFQDKQLEELEEARFFDGDTEIKIIRIAQKLHAWYTCLDAEDCIMKYSYNVRNPEFGGKIQVSQILDSDEDGQTYICDEKLSGWEA